MYIIILASRTTDNSVEISYISDINLRYTFKKSAVKIDRQILFPCVHACYPCDFLSSPALRESLLDQWKTTSCKKATDSPQLDLLADWPERYFSD